MEAVCKGNPKTVIALADGPRPHRPDDVENCKNARVILEQSIPSGCKLVRHYQEVNLGVRANITQGLDHVFTKVNEAIILEDDCIPHGDFFPFCEELLERFSANPRIAQICGTNYQGGRSVTSNSYYFSRHPHIWGWATWKRAWCLRDISMSRWPDRKSGHWLREITGDAMATHYWQMVFDDCHLQKTGSLKSWAIPWAFNCWDHSMLSVIPNTNLVENIGMDRDATTTRFQQSNLSFDVHPCSFPLRHPEKIEANLDADRFTEEHFFYGRGLQRLYWKSRLPIPLRVMRRLQKALTLS